MPARAKPLKDVKLAPTRPNLGVEAKYRRRLERLIDKMTASTIWWTRAAYRANEPSTVIAMDAALELAMDAGPVATLRLIMRRLARYWEKLFAEEAEAVAAQFADESLVTAESSMQSAFRRAELFKVKFRPSQAVKDVLDATTAENVNLIRSIPQRHFQAITGAVMRSAQAGRDLETLTKEIQAVAGVTKRRAAFIAHDQNNKATAAITRTRQTELGITEAEWVHSGGGKVPRPTHVAAGARRQRYDVKKGWFDPHEKKFIYPGELINCRCVSRSIIPGVKM